MPEDGLDCGAVVGEPLAVLLRYRRFAGDLAELALDSQEFLEQKGAPWPGFLSEEFLDAGRGAARLPLAFEAIGRLVDPRTFANQGVAHAFPPSD